MIGKIRQLIPNKFVNYGKHFPEAVLANLRSGFPGKKMRVIGVTGTDGKTTTVNMVYKILKDAGKTVSVVSTINAVVAGNIYDTGFHVTSPSSSDVQRFLQSAYQSNDEFMVLEVTSHALEQFRVWGVKFEVGVVTNVTPEHLDYHKTFGRYLSAKSKLIKSTEFAILNRDNPSFGKLAKITQGKVISFGAKKAADINPFNFPLNLKIPGKYNVYNAEAAAGVGLALGIGRKNIKVSLENFSGLPGRMEEVENTRGMKIFVDFAHTPNALREALKTLDIGKKGKLISVIGAEGKRDVGKRPLLGEIAGKMSDFVVITAVDPRGELRKINENIMQGARKTGLKEHENLFVIDRRDEAISFAINKLAKRGDTIGIFGKGHEKSINYHGEEELWSDTEAVRKALKNERSN